jgi:purine nucleosidase
LGVTTVSGEPAKRAELASAICHAAGRPEVPIHVGAADPILIEQPQKHASQHEALGEQWTHDKYEAKPTALEFLRQTIRSRPGEITLLTIGPLTNIALLFALDPELPGMLKQIVLMAGRFFTRSREGHVVEWNMLCDPHAAAKVFKAPVPKFIAVGLDVTTQCQMDADECRRRFTEAGGPLAPVAAMAEVWFRHTNKVTFHDPLAASLIFEPSLCELDTCHIEVDILNAPTMGHTYHRYNTNQSPHQVAHSVDVKGFFEHYFSVVSR